MAAVVEGGSFDEYVTLVGLEWDMQVRAVSASGVSRWSDTVTATSSPGDLPGTPPNALPVFHGAETGPDGQPVIVRDALHHNRSGQVIRELIYVTDADDVLEFAVFDPLEPLRPLEFSFNRILEPDPDRSGKYRYGVELIANRALNHYSQSSYQFRLLASDGKGTSEINVVVLVTPPGPGPITTPIAGTD